MMDNAMEVFTCLICKFTDQHMTRGWNGSGHSRKDILGLARDMSEGNAMACTMEDLDGCKYAGKIIITSVSVAGNITFLGTGPLRRMARIK